MSRVRSAALTVVLLIPASCGGDDDATIPAVTEDTSGVIGEDIEFTRRANYDIAYEVCSELTPQELAGDLGAATTSPADIALAFSEGYLAQYRQANFEGCLDALLGRPENYGD